MFIKDYECVIGLEIHVQLQTQSKMFCSCSNNFNSGDNENVCPVCIGMPGALPVLNEKALEFAVKTGLALNAKIREKSIFARKNYFYPDLPKGYQISQYDQPICEGGYIDIVMKDGTQKRVNITRAHLEEDAGKSNHHGQHTLVNYNRSSVPLLEIVSEPDMRSPAEAAAYAKAMRSIVQFLGVCDGNLEEGSMRADCNVSVRKIGAKQFGTKVEIKNINSFRFIEKALLYEFERQVDAVENGEAIQQETRLYDTTKNKTYSMRSKEDAHDYRYFPEPDLLAAEAPASFVEKVKTSMPELPLAMAERFQKQYELPVYDSFVLTSAKDLADYFEACVKISGNAKLSSNWIMVELLRELNDAKLEIHQSKISSNMLGEMIALIDKGEISGKMAKTVFEEMWATGKSPKEVVKAKGLTQITDLNQIAEIVQKVMDASPAQLADYRSGKDKLFGFFVGQCMKASGGQAHPELLNQVLKEKLKA